jgi:trehalose/maltose hydrolase-like predicted phosphorylase
VTRLRFRLRWRNFRIIVDVTGDEVTYTLRDGPDGELMIRHDGEELELTTHSPTTVPLVKRKPLLAPPQQPPGREPLHH